MCDDSRMFLDIFAAVCVVIGAIFGSPSGTTHQLVRLTAVVFAAMGARFGLGAVAGFFYRMSGSSFETAVGTCYLVAFALWFVLLWLASEELSNRIRDSQTRGPNDRYGGALLGALRGAVLAYAVTVGLLTVQPSLAFAGGDGEGGRVGRWVSQRNYLAPVLDHVTEREELREDEAHDRSWERATEP